MKTGQTLIGRYLKDVKPGTLSWIGLRPERKAPLTVVTSVMALKDMGFEGDHRCAKKPGSGRQVTLISEEYIQQIEHFTGKQSIHPELLRRNLVVKNINLSALLSDGTSTGQRWLYCHAGSRRLMRQDYSRRHDQSRRQRQVDHRAR